MNRIDFGDCRETIRFGSVCSGIEAASVAWHPLGWRAAWLSEIEPFPCAVLAHHYPDVPNLGDMTTIARKILTGEVEAPDVFCGGTPCQAFSVAGLRESLADERGNLSLKFVEIADAIDHVRTMRGRPASVVFWENVPGVLSTKDNAFGCFLAGLAGEDEPLQPPGGKWSNAGCVHGPARSVAWRTLDAQYFGVAQRRRRVFVVASARNGFDPAAVLFEWDGLRRDSAPGREAGKVAPTIPARSLGGGGLGTDFDCDRGVIEAHVPEIARCIATREGSSQDWETTTMVTHSLRGEGFDASEDGTGRGTPLVPVTFRADAMREGTAKTPSADAEGRVRLRDPGMGMYEDIAPTLDCGAAHGVAQPIAFHPAQDPISSTDGTTHTMGCGSKNGTATVAVAFSSKDYGADATNDLAPTLRAMNHADSHANGGGQMAVAVPHTDIMPTMTCGGGHAASHNQVSGQMRDAYMVPTIAMQVRRLTAVECERLQGFPDNYTAIPWRKKPADECPDGPRYKALGNSWAVPNVRWIGERINAYLARSERRAA